MYQIKVVIALTLFLMASPVYAVPSLIPLLPILGVLIAKGVLLISSIFFLVLSFYKQNKKLFLSLGILFLIAFAAMMIFVKNG
jgi:hypothetical protein